MNARKQLLILRTGNSNLQLNNLACKMEYLVSVANLYLFVVEITSKTKTRTDFPNI